MIIDDNLIKILFVSIIILIDLNIHQILIQLLIIASNKNIKAGKLPECTESE